MKLFVANNEGYQGLKTSNNRMSGPPGRFISTQCIYLQHRILSFETLAQKGILSFETLAQRDIHFG